MDLAIEVPSDELSSVTTYAIWEEIFDKLAEYAESHRSTLVFVNTRKMVERVSHELGERLGAENVAAHHGSLARTLRLDAERRLKNGEVKILVATASLELGIDIGDVDLVCQIASTRAVSVLMQRVGRAGHWRGAIPKGRLFATTRDDLLEQAALVCKVRAGELDLRDAAGRVLELRLRLGALVGSNGRRRPADRFVVRAHLAHPEPAHRPADVRAHAGGRGRGHVPPVRHLGVRNDAAGAALLPGGARGVSPAARPVARTWSNSPSIWAMPG